MVMQGTGIIKMVKLYLTRHGETLENAAGVLQGQTPGHLSALGRQQAEKLRDSLSGMHFDALVVSDLKRAIDTAEILNQALHLPMTLCPLLRERDWGEFTGMHVTEIRVAPEDFPPSIENPEQLQRRARRFLDYLNTHFDGQTVIAVGHGYFNRCVVAEAEGKAVHDVPRWGNTELRMIEVSPGQAARTGQTRDDEVSAD